MVNIVLGHFPPHENVEIEPTCAIDSSNSKCGINHNYEACKVFKNFYENLQHLLNLTPFALVTSNP
jgi:hypothetical protein